MGQTSRSQKWKRENTYFINSKTGKIQYNKRCENCICACKQSYKSSVIACPFYTPKS